MKRFSSKSFALLISVLIMLLTGQGLASSLVLCVGEDGHSAFEQAFAGQCAPVQPSCPADGECACSADAHDHCGPCDDYSTSLESLNGRSRGDQDAAPLVPPAIAASPSFTFFVRDLTANLSPLPPPHPCTALVALRTIILLN